MERPPMTRQVSNLSENLTYGPEIPDFSEGSVCAKTRTIYHKQKKLFYILIGVVILGVTFSCGFFFGRSVEVANLLTVLGQRRSTVWCTDEDVDFKGANLVPKQGAQRGDTSTSNPRSVPRTSFFDRDCERQVMPSAHLYLDWISLMKDKSKLHWRENTPFSRGTGHISAEVIYRPQFGGLEVTQSGIYNVYCQLTFRPTSNAITRFVQCLFRATPRNVGNAEEVVCTQTTKMNVTDVEIVQPIRLQAAIKVDIGDILYVNVSDIASVFRSFNYNYFGIFKIS